MVVRVTHGYRKIDGKWLIVHEHASVASGKAVFESQ
jgi:ketosteroid isomerase-like protein